MKQVPDVVTGIKSKANCREIFKQFWPDKFHQQGNCVCPFHDDRTPSMQLTKERARCHAGCGSFDAIDLYAKGTRISNGEAINQLSAKFGLDSGKSRREVAVYDYTDKGGRLLFEVVRYEPKDFRQRRPDGNGGWIWNLNDVRRVPYRLPEIVKAQDIFIVEGERDVDNLAAEDIPATTAPHGAGKWPADFARYFKGKNVAILPDNDKPGRDHTIDVAKKLRGVAATVKIVGLPGLPPKGDVSDWLNAGGTKGKLLDLAYEEHEYDPGEDQGENLAGERVVEEIVKDISSRTNPNQGLISFSSFNSSEKNERADFDLKVFPTLPDKALSGIAGSFAALATRNSEADPAAVLATFLCRAGAEFGTGPYLMVGDTRHNARVSTVIVGNSSKARKGTSGKPVSRLFEFDAQGRPPDDPYKPVRVSSGPLSSGEGLIYNVRDQVNKWHIDKAAWVVEDPEVEDKRLFILDEELAAALQAMKREGNTLSTVIRAAFDSGNLEPLTKSNRIKATGAHIVIVSHITTAELHKLLDENQALNGFANRFLWMCARRQKLVPIPEPMPARELIAIQAELLRVIDAVKSFSLIKLSPRSRECWTEVYRNLSEEEPGLVGCIVNRGEALTLRLAMVYALLDASDTIKLDHLESALALWGYAKQSAEYIFSGRGANPIAQKILDACARGPLSATDIHKVFSNNATRAQILAALQELISSGKVEVTEEKTGGRPKQIFQLTKKTNLTKKATLPDSDQGVIAFNSFNSSKENENTTGADFPDLRDFAPMKHVEPEGMEVFRA
jgi:DNA-binding PadR family transcriptional regulator